MNAAAELRASLQRRGITPLAKPYAREVPLYVRRPDEGKPWVWSDAPEVDKPVRRSTRPNNATLMTRQCIDCGEACKSCAKRCIPCGNRAHAERDHDYARKRRRQAA